jgi:amino acid adenylation domain-containing protein
MKPGNVEAVCALSPIQEGILFHVTAAPEASLYSLQWAAVFAGDLRVPAFRHAWEEVVRRHGVLRTAFHWRGLAQPVQVTYRSVTVPWVDLDWRGLGEAEQLRRWEELCGAERRRCIDLEQPPLVRFHLVRLAARVHRFLWSYHHIVVDGWSLSILLGEVLALYDAARRQRTADLAPARPYREYVSWLRQHEPAGEEAHWRRALGDFTSPTVPGGLRDPDRQGGGERRCRVRESGLDAGTAAALEGLARRHRLTLNTLLQGAWALLLHRYADTDDVVFGVTLSGRSSPLPGVEGIVGPLINTLPLRLRVPHDQTVGEWLRAVLDRHAALLEFEHSPLVRVQGWSGVPAGTPLFETLLVFENYPPPGGDGEARRELALAIEPLATIDQVHYPLALSVFRDEAGLTLRLIHDGARCDDATAARWLTHARRLLAALLRRPEARLGEVPLLSAAELHQQRCEWNDTRAELGGEPTVDGLFATRAAERPAAVAVVTREEALTFAGLERRSSRLAERLWRRGLGPEARVGICLHRGPEWVVACLAVLRAGAAYAPFEPEYPRERLEVLLRDAGAEAILTAAATEGVAAEVVRASGWEVPRLAVAGAGDAPAVPRSGGGPRRRSAPESLAYVMYTSGSSGEPKGVAVTHRGVVRLVRAASYASLGPAETFLQLAPTGFDAATLEVWGALLNGGRLAVPPPGTPSLAELENLIALHGVTTLWLTAGYFHLVVDERPQALRPLRQLLAGGDTLSPARVRRLLAELPGLRLIDGYGPTENTTFTCCFPVADPRRVRERVPIGRPVTNTRVYLADERLRPPPAGVAGELYAGGLGLARGYLGRPGRTAAAFVPDPFSGERGERLYRTGDRARFLPDGNLDFLGRCDRQVKVRGFRVELGEVEAALRRLPGVAEAAVIATGEAAAERRLAAFWVPSRGAAPSEAELREGLRRLLPAAGVPALLLRLDALPATPSGKVDYRRLPALATVTAAAPSFLPPRDNKERRLAAIWARLLQLDRVGADDDFFALGGHSLLVMQLVSQIEEAFDARLPLAAVFENPTLADLTRAIRRLQRYPVLEAGGEAVAGGTAGGAAAPVVQLRAGGPGAPLFCVHGGGGHLLEIRRLALALGGDHRVYGLQAPGLETDREPLATIESLAATYLEAIRAVQRRGPYRLCGYCIGGLVAYEMAQRLRRAGEEVEVLALLDTGFVRDPDRRLSELWIRGEATLSFATELNTALSPETLRRTAPGHWMDTLWEEFQRQREGDAEKLGQPTFRRLYRVYVANLTASRSYVPRPYAGAMTLFLPVHGPSPEEREEALGWGELCAAGVESIVVPGSHVTLLRTPQVKTLARHLERLLDAPWREPPPGG